MAKANMTLRILNHLLSTHRVCDCSDHQCLRYRVHFWTRPAETCLSAPNICLLEPQSRRLGDAPLLAHLPPQQPSLHRHRACEASLIARLRAYPKRRQSGSQFQPPAIVDLEKLAKKWAKK